MAGLLAAFISTITTLFNWGSSYLMNDVFRRFIKSDSSEHSYVVASRFATVLIADAGASVALMADSILQLLSIFYVLGAGGIIIAFAQWFWWRLNRYGSIAGLIAGWVMVVAMLVFKIFDTPMAALLGLEDGVQFSTAERLTGARMLLSVVVVTTVTFAVTLLTPPEPMDGLKKFLLSARPFAFGWKPVIRDLGEPYDPVEGLGRTMISWFIGMVMVLSLIYGIGELILGEIAVGISCLALAIATLWWTLIRFKQDYASEFKAYEKQGGVPGNSTAEKLN